MIVTCSTYLVFKIRIKTVIIYRCISVCLAICYQKNEPVLDVRRIMRHLVIHSDSCGCLSPGIESEKLMISNGYSTMVICQLTCHCLFVIFLAKNNTVFTILGPLRLLPVSKTKRHMKGRRFATKKSFTGRAQDYTKK